MTLEEFLRHFSHFGGPLFVLVILPLAGVVASAVCPCTIPVGIGIAGMAGTSEAQNRREGVRIATGFFLGIVVNLAILGALSGGLGAILGETFGQYWAFTMALASLVAAVIAFRGPQLDIERLTRMRRPGVFGAFVYGFIFSLGTSAAPLLLVLTVAAAHRTAGYGLLLSVAFGIGRGLPFLLIGLFAGTMARFVRMQRWRRIIQVLSGTALVFVSGYYGWVFASLL
ncbi:MAG: thiol:disulfide interchange protein [Acidobacteriales bacterium 59-55]|nr:sulfite exporter TauE/SafE family protein [Terriglobales bacterium]OJV44677.1 MAG: thiol:disulfide interchange protein [Acidobacteriales bacterium 59-55]